MYNIDRILFIILFLLVTVRSQIKGRYTRNVKQFEVVIPKKVSSDGEFLSYYLPHFYNVERIKRGADTGKINYVVPLNGEEKVLELLPTEDFYAPGMVLEHHEKDASNNINSVKLRKPRPRRCYYHGIVKDEPSSSAAISTCSGLAGSIRIGNENYLIEPVDDEGKPTFEIKHRHLLYKRAIQRDFYCNSTCATKGNFATSFKERMEWEDKYGLKLEESIKGTSYREENLQSSKESNLDRTKRWCSTSKPNENDKSLTPNAPCLLDQPLFIELLIVIGPRVATTKFLDDDLELYVNTIINIAIKNFQDSTIGRPIRVKLVRVITLGFLYEFLDVKRHNPQESLKRFCEWQMHFNPRMEDHPNHHDFAIYLAKFEPCLGSILGLTNMASMCRPDRSCAVVEEEGLLTGAIITHMLGHSLGAEHDDSSTNSCCPEEPDGTKYHMGTDICSRSSAWSVCSKQCILQFVKTHAGWCLTDIPTTVELTDPVVLPGQVYSAAEQCRINYEIETHACLVGEFCQRLYCKINDKECVSTGDPPAQGTRCGPNMWCFNGQCVHRGTRPGATNGEWGPWSPWTPCSKTCGGGIESSRRACDSPSPSHGGRLCLGSWIKSRMCNVGGCPDAGKGFLDKQCKNTNSRPYRGGKHEWLYFNQQIEDVECVVICVNERNEVAVRSPLALDGTFCKPGTRDVCIRGGCKKVGCDWVIGSNAKEDACGICHGNGTECRIMQGFFADRNVKGLTEFLKLPIGTSMVLVRETHPSPCSFIISNSLNSTSYLNSVNEEQLIFTGAFSIRGTVGVYQLKSDMERIFIKEPLVVPITLSIMCHASEKAVGILYQYALPEPNKPSTIPSYSWEFLAWEKCQFPCGGGAQRSIPTCVEAQGGEVEDCYCSLQARPPDKVRLCNKHPCDARWWVGPWANCECFHQEGVTSRMVMCAHLTDARSNYITIAPKEECQKNPKPITEKPCDPKKEKEMWAKLGYIRKRDLTDIVPYSDDAEDYYVWSDIAEDKYPFIVNVRDKFQHLNPETLNDFVYLKKIGLDIHALETFVGKQQEECSRVRIRRQKVSKKEPSPKPKNKQTRHLKSEKIKKIQTNINGTTRNKMASTISAIPVTTRKMEKHLERVTGKQISENVATSPVHTTDQSTKNVTTKNEPIEKNKEEIKVSTVSVNIKHTPMHKRKHSHKSNHTVTETARAATTGSENVATLTPALTVPVANADPGVTPFSMYASETPAPQGKCWKVDMKLAKSKPSCKPPGEASPEPAEGAPEIDFLNVSNVKIYIVPIQTTIRTIIQNDQEFIMMETLAKYPIGDELNVVEHWGDAATRELKLARDRLHVNDSKPPMYD